MADEKDINKVNEPNAEYVIPPKLGDVFKTITFSTLEKMDDERRQYSADLTPEQRMAYLFELNKVAFGQILQQPITELWTKEIIIDNTR